ncbi:SpoIID/LytB domain-containing protein [Serpentinicella sp. ANB-PHB4]|uniref:SpoIID/LytB domain-containing protein n=1 Tax=Serpentinicella sp. ANB-PHB4 TaxID=3074076 RepID=UPI0028618CFC|nr:SpoIID/LytB domain-containing protein [Serpentinicella sp. ANB-PHB4]MDR5659180.1 SpoIID/LytB domain-containing protein [Serpentinicella sp. ANB-PHB4]
MINSKYRKLIVLLIVLTIILAACRPEQRPEIEGQDEQPAEMPAIPEEISQGEGQEPMLNVYIAETGEIREMAFEEYLNGVLAAEMNNDFPLEALKAQAILARTYAMGFIADGKSKHEGAHISTDIEEAQAWKEEEVNERIEQAVQESRGMVAVYDNQYINAWFHAHAGGQTATAQEGLDYDEEEPPYVHVVESPDSPEAPEEDANWTETFSKDEIIAAVQELGEEVGDFSTIEVIETGPSGRATMIQIGEAEVSAPGFRIAIGSTRMKSTFIENVAVEGDQVSISGTGYGHGVGMSQWGAYQLAEEGSVGEEIVKHYFKDINVVQLWE